jgi:hypothetical protein
MVAGFCIPLRSRITNPRYRVCNPYWEDAVNKTNEIAF